MVEQDSGKREVRQPERVALHQYRVEYAIPGGAARREFRTVTCVAGSDPKHKPRSETWVFFMSPERCRNGGYLAPGKNPSRLLDNF